MKDQVVVIGGPTAAGKTDIAIKIAQVLDGEVLSADSRQCYRELTIGTAKPDDEQLAAVPHHFINSHSIREVVSAGDYSRWARDRMREIFSRKSLVVMTGGTGLYIRAGLEGIDEMPETAPELRSELNSLTLSELQEKLGILDPEYAEKVDLQNPQRLVRALEVSITSGQPYSSFLGNRTPVPYPVIRIALDLDRQVLYDRINHRVDEMVGKGLFGEAASLKEFRSHYALKTVGYKEVFDYLDGRLGKEEAIEKIKQNTRRYAKRQLTWFRKEDYTWFNPEDGPKIVQFVTEMSH